MPALRLRTGLFLGHAAHHRERAASGHPMIQMQRMRPICSWRRGEAGRSVRGRIQPSFAMQSLSRQCLLITGDRGTVVFTAFFEEFSYNEGEGRDHPMRDELR